MAEARQITCAKCHGTLPTEPFNSGKLAPCPACATPFRVEIFPAFFQEHFTASGGETLLIDAEAGCFYHPQKKAAAVCDGCGRFLCGLCDVDLNSQHLCPSCIETGRKKKKLKNLENERTLYDSTVFLLSFGALLMWPVTIITAPATLYMVIRYWNAPGSLIPRSKIRYVLAFLFALLQVCGWAFAIFYLVTHQR